VSVARLADDDLARVAALVRSFEHVARTRMAGLPVVHPGLRVVAVGFRVHDEALVGVLVTPWFMNLVRLPRLLEPTAAGVGRSTEHSAGSLAMTFVGAHEPELGAFACCSLFSPLFAFKDQEAVEATAEAVMRDLFGADDAQERAPASAAAERGALDRRGFLFGRRGGSAP
jgi:[NiFe] hydrogenase assembly HybE family chaperone